MLLAGSVEEVHHLHVVERHGTRIDGCAVDDRVEARVVGLPVVVATGQHGKRGLHHPAFHPIEVEPWEEVLHLLPLDGVTRGKRADSHYLRGRPPLKAIKSYIISPSRM